LSLPDSPDTCVLFLVCVGVRPAMQCDRRTHLSGGHFATGTSDKTRLPRLPIDRRRDAGQAAYPHDRPHAATLYATKM